ncbi:MAG: rhamnulokinase family protein, partial [Ruthenibacterium sp.]
MITKNYVAMDFGASNGRGMIGRFNGKTIKTEELYRFENHLYQLRNTCYWDVLALVRHCKHILSCTVANGIKADGIGIDTWGLDYGLLDRNGDLMGNVISYRSAKEDAAKELLKKVESKEVFLQTGTGNLVYNTIFQLYARKLRHDPCLEAAKTFLMLPDLLAYFLTGQGVGEYTNALTTMMVDCEKRDWAYDLLETLELPTQMLPVLVAPSTKLGCLTSTVQAETGLGAVPFYTVATHDTASAIAAVPAHTAEFAYISSGTWSLIGTQCDKPILSEAAFLTGYSNEGSLQGGYRLNKNIMGLALIQACSAVWNRGSQKYSWDDIVLAAKQAKPFQRFLNTDAPCFMEPSQILQKINRLCAESNQSMPETMGEYARCLYENLAMRYRQELAVLEHLTGTRYDVLHIVGGGCKNSLLNQFTADAIGRPVYAGPVEGACMGNALSQAIAQGELADVTQLRQ